MLSFECRFYALFLLDTIKIKPICWKQTIKMETSILKVSHDSSSFDRRDYVLWQPFKVITVLHHQHCCSIPIFWILYSLYIGFSEGSDQRKLQGVILPVLSEWRNWIIQGLWVQPKTGSRHHKCSWGPTISSQLKRGDTCETPEWILGG